VAGCEAAADSAHKPLTTKATKVHEGSHSDREAFVILCVLGVKGFVAASSRLSSAT
jgi:hypothetical protein